MSIKTANKRIALTAAAVTLGCGLAGPVQAHSPQSHPRATTGWVYWARRLLRSGVRPPGVRSRGCTRGAARPRSQLPWLRRVRQRRWRIAAVAVNRAGHGGVKAARDASSDATGATASGTAAPEINGRAGNYPRGTA
jgi:hypothetical protein